MTSIIHNAVITASAQSGLATPPIDLSNGFRATAVFSAMGGTTPSFTVAIQESADGVNWTTIGTFAAATADGFESIDIAGPVHGMLRCDFTVSGTTPTANIAVYLG